MVNYQLGKIYKIVCNTTGLIYIGSTCEPILARRLAKHRTDYKRYFDGKSNYITSFKILENNNYEIILIENVICESKDELHKKERFHIESYECVNKHIPGRTHTEYYNENKEIIIEKSKIYANNNKDIIKSQQHNKYLKNADAIKEKVNIYRVNNQESIKDKKKLYYEKNSEYLKTKAKAYREKQKANKLCENII